MNTFFRILQLSVPVLLLIAPYLLYRKRSSRFVGFYVDMTIDPRCRKEYRFALAVLALIFNFSIFALEGASLWQIPGFLLGMLLLRNSFTDAMLHWLHEDRMLQGLAFGFILISLVVPQLFSLSVTMALILKAAFFYPSRAILDHAKYPKSYVQFHLTPDDIVNVYFSSSRANGFRHRKPHGCQDKDGSDN